ncbi:MAG: NAD(P)H-binding protein, partial [Rhodocyclaceae bacterium]|nr:NAD(P)H-binding protein [Rhodocyclaceae bacterium]
MPATQTVVVFNASSRQGLAQVRQLLKSGHKPRAVTRQAGIFATPAFAGVDVVAADFTDPASLDRAVAGADAIFFQPPLLDIPDHLHRYA